MERTFMILLRFAAGLAVGFWGLSKLLFVQNWIKPYQMFYPQLPISGTFFVYLLGIVQIAIALAIIFEFYRKPAAWIAVIFSTVNLIAGITAVLKPENPIAANPAPWGIKLIWFFFDPLAILLLLISVGLMPRTSRQTASESDQMVNSE